MLLVICSVIYAVISISKLLMNAPTGASCSKSSNKQSYFGSQIFIILQVHSQSNADQL